MDPFPLLARMMELVQKDAALDESRRADAVRDLGCLKLQLVKTTLSPAVIAALLDELEKAPSLAFAVAELRAAS